jgi:predicted DNA-binding protein
MNEETKRRIMSLELALKLAELSDRTGVTAANMAKAVIDAAKKIDDYVRGAGTSA